LAPFAPHLSEEIWHLLGNKTFISIEGWPKFDKKIIDDAKAVLAVQINGKVRGEIEASREATENEVIKMAQMNPIIASKLEGKEVFKVIYVPGRVLNLMVK
jgi:leucyl-tRNA synthetase